LKEEKQKRNDEELKLHSLDRINYFPFTHGDLIDKQRSVLAEILKNEHLLQINEKAMKAAEIKRERN
jgi:hypothetical protein